MGDKKVYIYKDRFTGDDMFSGAYPCTLEDDFAFCVEGKSVPKGGEKFDLGRGDAFGSVAEEEVDDSVEMVINIIDTARLQQTAFDKKSFLEYLKPYLGRIKKELEATNPSRVAPFMKGADAFVKKVVGKFSEFDFYVNESMNYEAGIALQFYKEDGITPYFYFIRDGLLLGFPGFGKDLSKGSIVPPDVANKQGFVI